MQVSLEQEDTRYVDAEHCNELFRHVSFIKTHCLTSAKLTADLLTPRSERFGHQDLKSTSM